jgi:hypothetical protein
MQVYCTVFESYLTITPVQWNVEPKGNGKCIISNVYGKTYLAWEKSKDRIAQVTTSETPVEWFIKSLGEYLFVSPTFLAQGLR